MVLEPGVVWLPKKWHQIVTCIGHSHVFLQLFSMLNDFLYLDDNKSTFLLQWQETVLPKSKISQNYNTVNMLMHNQKIKQIDIIFSPKSPLIKQSYCKLNPLGNCIYRILTQSILKKVFLQYSTYRMIMKW